MFSVPELKGFFRIFILTTPFSVAATAWLCLIVGGAVSLVPNRDPSVIDRLSDALLVAAIITVVGLNILTPTVYLIQSKKRKGDPNRFTRTHRRNFLFPREPSKSDIISALEKLGYVNVATFETESGYSVSAIRPKATFVKSNSEQIAMLNSRSCKIVVDSSGERSEVEFILTPTRFIEIADMTQSSYFLAKEFIDYLGWEDFEQKA